MAFNSCGASPRVDVTTSKYEGRSVDLEVKCLFLEFLEEEFGWNIALSVIYAVIKVVLYAATQNT